jgi:protein O-GlcNAc transferase
LLVRAHRGRVWEPSQGSHQNRFKLEAASPDSLPVGKAAARKRARAVAVPGAIPRSPAAAGDTPEPAPSPARLAARAREAADAGDLERAMADYAEAVRRGHTSPDVHNDLGVLLAQRGLLGAAVVQLELALALLPRHREARANLMKALETISLQAFQQRRWRDAASGYSRLVQLDQDSAVFHNNAGAAFRELGELGAALPHLERARELVPESAVVHYNLGSALYALRRVEAEDVLARAVQLDPAYADAYVNLALVYDRLGRLSQAASTLRTALELAPEKGEAHGNLAGVLREQGDLDGSLRHYRRAMALVPDSPTIRSSYLLALQAHPDTESAELLREHRDWARRFAAPLDPCPAQPGPGPGTVKVEAAGGARVTEAEIGRPLRIGYISPDLRTHSVAFFIEPLLAAHDRTAFEVWCYSDAAPDAVTGRIRARADGWREIRGQDDGAVAARIAADGIDILVDLAGHTADNRLLVLARRPAPVQVTYCGYPGTTGLPAIDWRLTDAVADPEGYPDRHHAERLWRLPGGFLCYQPEAGAPEPGPPAFLSSPGGGITFASFNNLAKLNDRVMGLWAELLGAVPGSTLLLKSRALSDHEPRIRLRAAFAAARVAPSRLRFAPYAASTVDHLRLYREVDVALDPFPYCGTTTTCEALWMGVPVVTLAGLRHAARVGASLLPRAGLQDLVTESERDYLERAINLARDTDRLVTLRRELRPRLAASSLTNPAILARDIEHAYREMWRLRQV